ncbi:MAG: chemotaxis protein CheD [Bacillota bacterium]
MEMHSDGEEIKVGIAEWKIADGSCRLVTLGLGSCVGVAVYDALKKIGGLAHVMLPDSKQFNSITNPAKYADMALPAMVEEMVRRGASKNRMKARIAGGAQMFISANRSSSLLNIGQRNTEMCRKILIQLGIPLVAEDTGGNKGRTTIFHTDTGCIYIRTVGEPLRTL